MDFFTSGRFWFLEGLLFCLLLAGIRAWITDRGLPMPFWKWFLTVVWILFAGFTIAFIGTCLGESERTAAIKGGVLFGVLATITSAGLLRILLAGKTSPDASPSTKEM